MLKVKALTKQYGNHVVVDAVDLRVKAGQCVALRGPNGAGKSTLLRCITGADRPTSGTVMLDDRPLDETDPRMRTDLAVVMDDLDFFPDLTVVEHLDLLASAHRVPDAETVVDDVLNDVGLIDVSGQFPGTLSSGQRRRLGLATAFVRPRRLLVLDEPEARLDVEGLDWLGGRLAAELKEGLALLLATHSPALVERIATKVVTLSGPTQETAS